ncbi:MAG TPA: tRNA (adenosine(37)-N6)-threonylcarbamoyltransferase complex ATPase subunit type 1 TsaE [Synergistaceae bacterium]|nr:tRNA (adenosine(37)-N6)-threonylcarbamoyltransferase complex ATPase subunit type 1 TsaE [Synergistaceae bacterium]HQF92355.1 tRNA (adenosine(37)-N6)-threonylcarbamoyltransferase complex ATPase subunit type 1 TsaE [Synergistaceae bacterium]
MDSRTVFVETSSPEETHFLGEALARGSYPGLALLLCGDLGSGKTEMVRGFMARWGYHQVRSPSFALVHEYPTAPPVVHVDLYRLSTLREEDGLGLEEYLLRGSVLLVEWGEKWKTHPLQDLWEGDFSFLGDFSLSGISCRRRVALRAWGNRAQDALDRSLAWFCAKGCSTMRNGGR